MGERRPVKLPFTLASLESKLIVLANATVLGWDSHKNTLIAKYKITNGMTSLHTACWSRSPAMRVISV